jgi:hypothetical protein
VEPVSPTVEALAARIAVRRLDERREAERPGASAAVGQDGAAALEWSVAVDRTAEPVWLQGEAAPSAHLQTTYAQGISHRTCRTDKGSTHESTKSPTKILCLASSLRLSISIILARSSLSL